MKRRRKKNPSSLVYVGVGVGVLAVGVGGFFLFRKQEQTKALEDAVAAGVAAGDAAVPILAVVTTNDPPPSGDLAIRSGPSDDAPIIGGAEKSGTVVVLDGNSTADYAKVQWDGGSRRPAVTGFAHKSALSLV